MRKRILLVGVVVLLVSIVLVVVGTYSSALFSVSANDATELKEPSLPPLSSPYSLLVTWTDVTNASFTLEILANGSSSSCDLAALDGCNVVAHGNGTSGSLTFTAGRGDHYWVVTNQPATLLVAYTDLVVAFGIGIILLILAVVLILVGAILREKSTGANPSLPPNP